MRKLQMVDLQTQYERLKPNIDDAIKNVINDAKFINGPYVNQFAGKLASYLNVKHVIPCANGTDALQIALMASDIKPGDEVITTDFTFIATVEVISLLGAKPVLIDVNPYDFTIDTDQIESNISEKTKAIIPVHLFGQCANMNKIIEIAQKHHLKVIEDTAQAISTDYFIKNTPQKAGTIGNIGCTSFFPSKNLGCYGDGGAIYTNDDQLAERIKMITNHGSQTKYYHEIIGVNSRLDAMQAAILSEKLNELDDYTKRRQAAAIFYDYHLGSIKEIEIPYKRDDSTHTYHQYTIKLPKGTNKELQAFLNEQGIPSMIYYPVPLHSQKAFTQWMDNRSFPVADELSDRVLSLPMHTELDKEQLEYICTTIKSFF